MSQLVVEAHCLQGPRRNRGIGRYVAALVRALDDIGVVGALTFNPRLGPPPTHDLEIGPERWIPTTRPALRRAVEELREAVYLVTSPFELPFGPDAALPPGTSDLMPIATIMHDLIPLRFAEHYLDTDEESARYMGHLIALDASDLFLCNSDATRSDVVSLLGMDARRVMTIGAGVPEGFAPASKPELLPWEIHRRFPEVIRPYVICVAAYEWRKNVSGLLRAWSKVSPEIRIRHQLVVVCELPAPGRAEWTAQCDELGLGSNVVFTGEVTETTLRVLYQGASASIFPSRYEGVGFPPLEAMACGIPSLVARNSSLVEIGHESSWFDVDDEDEIAARLTDSLLDEGFRQRLLAAGREVVERHTWSATAATTVRAVSTIPRRTRSRTLRIALVGPFAPDRTGVGIYNSRLAIELGALARVDYFVEGDWRLAEVGAGDVFPAQALGNARRPEHYDASLFTLGNSPFHLATYKSLLRCGGIAWFHDVNLAALHQTRIMRESSDVDARTRSALREMYGPNARLPRNLVEHGDLAAAGFFTARTAAKAAARCITSSAHAAAYLELDVGRRLSPPPTVLPLAFPPSEANAAAAGPRPVIVALGSLHEIKRPGVLVEAVAALKSSERPMLVFAGPDLLSEPWRFRKCVQAAGVEHDVVVTGWLTESEYWDWIANATIVVQLRERSYGESSAAVAEAMAAGRVVVTSVTACDEFPPGVHVQVGQQIEAQALAIVIGQLLENPTERSALACAAREYAATWTFRDVARRLVDLIEDDAS